MNVLIGENYNDMSQIAANYMLASMLQSKRVNIAITAGSSPIGLYQIVVPQVKNKSYFTNVHYYNFDEIPYKTEDREGVTMEDLRKLYFTPAAVPEKNIHILDQHNWEGYDEKIKQDGGLDFVILGLGEDGHFCGNLPSATIFCDQTTKVNCNEYLQSRVALDFQNPKDAPNYFITMGPRTIMNAKKIVMIVSGKKKSKVLKKNLKGPVTENIPSSVFQLPPDFTVILDKEAALEL